MCIDVQESTSPTNTITPYTPLSSAVLCCDGVEMQHTRGGESNVERASFERVGVGTEADDAGFDRETREWGGSGGRIEYR